MNLNETKLKLIEMCPEGQNITTAQVVKHMGINRHKVNKNMRQLIAAGYFVAEGVNQHRSYKRTSKELMEGTGRGPDYEHFQYARDAATFPLRA